LYLVLNITLALNMYNNSCDTKLRKQENVN